MRYKHILYLGPAWICDYDSEEKTRISDVLACGNQECVGYKKRICVMNGSYCVYCGQRLTHITKTSQETRQDQELIVDGCRKIGTYHPMLVIPKDTSPLKHIFVATDHSPWPLYYDSGHFMMHDPPEGDLRHEILSYFEKETWYLKTHYDRVQYTWKIVEWYEEI